MPEHVQQAKESTAKDNLRVLRGVIEAYAAQHNDIPPGHVGKDPDSAVVFAAFADQIISGNYLKEIPENPFNNKKTILMIANNGTIPAASGDYGWVYKAQTKTTKLDFPGTDSENVPYYDY